MRRADLLWVEKGRKRIDLFFRFAVSDCCVSECLSKSTTPRVSINNETTRKDWHSFRPSTIPEEFVSPTSMGGNVHPTSAIRIGRSSCAHGLIAHPSIRHTSDF